ncbi:MAG TPA: type II secretion system protein, partial [Candidatus Nitrosocosmicus sp.]|nr:type II secretion system protein [Candidatus Nitrosocosmicus sp.]
MRRKKRRAFTIIEVLIFITLISFLFISVSYIMTATLRDTRSNEYKLVATHYADELKEWLRGEKEDDWNNFITHEGSYCFNSTILEWPSSGSCSGYINDSYDVFQRSVKLTKDSANQMTVNIQVVWNEA